MGEYFGSERPGDGPGTRGRIDDQLTGDLLDLEGVYAVIDHPRRRRVLDAVRDEEAVSMDELAARVAAREAKASVQDVCEDECRSVAIALHHVHVPKLADAGVIDVDHGTDRIEPGPRLDRVVDALDGLSGSLEGDGPTLERGRPD